MPLLGSYWAKYVHAYVHALQFAMQISFILTYNLHQLPLVSLLA